MAVNYSFEQYTKALELQKRYSDPANMAFMDATGKERFSKIEKYIVDYAADYEKDIQPTQPEVDKADLTNDNVRSDIISPENADSLTVPGETEKKQGFFGKMFGGLFGKDKVKGEDERFRQPIREEPANLVDKPGELAEVPDEEYGQLKNLMDIQERKLKYLDPAKWMQLTETRKHNQFSDDAWLKLLDSGIDNAGVKAYHRMRDAAVLEHEKKHGFKPDLAKYQFNPGGETIFKPIINDADKQAAEEERKSKEMAESAWILDAIIEPFAEIPVNIMKKNYDLVFGVLNKIQGGKFKYREPMPEVMKLIREQNKILSKKYPKTYDEGIINAKSAAGLTQFITEMAVLKGIGITNSALAFGTHSAISNAPEVVNGQMTRDEYMKHIGFSGLTGVAFGLAGQGIGKLGVGDKVAENMLKHLKRKGGVDNLPELTNIAKLGGKVVDKTLHVGGSAFAGGSAQIFRNFMENNENIMEGVPETAQHLALYGLIMGLPDLMKGRPAEYKQLMKTAKSMFDEKIFRKQVAENGMPKSVTVSAKAFADYFNRVGIPDAEVKEAMQLMEFSKKDLFNIAKAKKGVTVEIPMEKIVNLVDRPYWQKVKGVFGGSTKDSEILSKSKTGGEWKIPGEKPKPAAKSTINNAMPKFLMNKTDNAGKQKIQESLVKNFAEIEDLQKKGDTAAAEAKIAKVKAGIEKVVPKNFTPEETEQIKAHVDTIKNEELGITSEGDDQLRDTTKKVEIETDAARVQEIKNSIAEGEMILKSGKKITGEKYTPGELETVKRSVENSKKKIGVDVIKNEELRIKNEGGEKQPYEMTFKEFIGEDQRIPYINSPYFKKLGMRGSEMFPDDINRALGHYKNMILRPAIAEGKKIPEEVLQDYPDLQKEVSIGSRKLTAEETAQKEAKEKKSKEATEKIKQEMAGEKEEQDKDVSLDSDILDETKKYNSAKEFANLKVEKINESPSGYFGRFDIVNDDVDLNYDFTKDGLLIYQIHSKVGGKKNGTKLFARLISASYQIGKKNLQVVGGSKAFYGMAKKFEDSGILKPLKTYKELGGKSDNTALWEIKSDIWTDAQEDGSFTRQVKDSSLEKKDEKAVQDEIVEAKKPTIKPKMEEKVGKGKAEIKPGEPKPKKRVVKKKSPVQVHKHVINSSKKNNREMEILQTAKVKNGRMTTSDLSIYVSTPTDLPDGMYEMRGNKFVESKRLAKEFPKLDPDKELTKKNKVNEITGDLRGYLQKALHGTSKEINRPIFNGISTEIKDGKVTIAATDGKRIKTYETDLKATGEDNSFILSGEIVEEYLYAMGDDAKLQIYGGDSKPVFTDGETYVTGYNIVGRYPNYEKAYPDVYEKTTVFDKESLLDALKKVAPYVSDETSKVMIKFNEGEDTADIIGARSNLEEDVSKTIKVKTKTIPAGKKYNKKNSNLLMPLRLEGIRDRKPKTDEIGLNVYFFEDLVKDVAGEFVYFSTINETTPTIVEDMDIFTDGLSRRKNFQPKTGELYTEPEKGLSSEVKANLKVIKSITNVKGTMPILNNVMVEDGKMYATNLETTLMTDTDMADGMYKFVGDTLEPNAVDKTQFPIMPKAADFKDSAMKITGDLGNILSSLDGMLGDIGHQELMNAMVSVENGKVLVEGADSHAVRRRLMSKAKATGDDTYIFIPSDTIKALKRIKSDKIELYQDKGKTHTGVDSNRIMIKAGGFTMFAYDPSVDYRSKRDLGVAYPETLKSEIKVKKKDLQKALKEAKAIVGKDAKVSMVRDGKSQYFSVWDDNNKEHIIPIEVQVKDVNISRYDNRNVDLAVGKAPRHKHGESLVSFNVTDVDKLIKIYGPDVKIYAAGKGNVVLTDGELTMIKKQVAGKAGQSTDRFAEDDKIVKSSKLRPIELPELTQMVYEVLQEYPNIMQYRATLRGMFYGSGKIGLNKDLFTEKEMSSGQAEKTLRHEIGHVIDWLPERKGMKGSLLARVTGMKGLAKQIITKEGEGGELLSNRKKLMNKIYRAKKAEANGKNHKYDIPALEKALDAINEKMIFNKDLREELWNLSKEWRPVGEGASESHIKYRKSSPELYADFVSVLFSDPGLAEAKAPKFYDAFFRFLDSKAEFKDIFFGFMDFLSGPTEAILKARHVNIEKMWDKSEPLFKAKRDLLKARQKSVWFMLKTAVVNRNNVLYDMEKKLKIKNDSDKITTLLDERNFIDMSVKHKLEGFQEIREMLRTADIPEKDLDTMLYAKRNITNRKDVAAPLGMTKDYSKGELKALKKAMGDEKFAELEKITEKLQQWWYDEIILPAKDLISDKMLDKMKKERELNYVYAPYFVQKYFLENNVSAAIIEQIGTLQEILKPSTAMLMKGVAIIKATENNRIKKESVPILLESGNELARIVRKSDKNGKLMTIKPARKPGTEILYWKDRGVLKAMYVDPYIHRSFVQDMPLMNNLVTKVMSKPNRLFKSIYTTFNVGFQIAFNPIRDFSRTHSALSFKGKNISWYELLYYYGKNIKHARNRALGKPDAKVREMEEARMLFYNFSDYLLGLTEKGFDKLDENEKILSRFDVINLQRKCNPLLKPTIFMLEQIRHFGDVMESLSKIASYDFLKNEQGDDKLFKDMRDLSAFIRNRVGTPPYMRGGEYSPASNNILLFSNIMIQGWIEDFKAAMTDTRTRAGFRRKLFRKTVLPKVIMWLLASGAVPKFMKTAFPDDEEKQQWAKEMQENYAMISEYDKTNYTCIPIGRNAGRCMYVRLPEHETFRFMGGAVWKGLNAGQDTDLLKSFTDIADYSAGQFPTLSPAIQIVSKWVGMGLGKQQTDDFRDRTIGTDTEWEAGGWDKTRPMLIWTLEQFGMRQGFDLTNRTKLEKALKFTPVINRLVKISDFGISEELNAAAEGAIKENAKKLLEKKEFMNDFVDKYYETAEDKGLMLDYSTVFENLRTAAEATGAEFDPMQFFRTYSKNIISKKRNPYVNGLVYAKTNAEKDAKLKKMQTMLEPGAFEEVLQIAKIGGFVNDNLYKKYLVGEELPEK
jgi:DNA polymerase III sliding clamp (beta) subunit (PCNA family)/uncharacterized membrane-anchored protein YhcB (DUF1043 family)